MKLTRSTALAAFFIIGLGGFIAGRISFSDEPANPPPDAGQRQVTRSGSHGESAVDQASLRKTAAANQSQRTGKTSVQDHKARLEAIVRGENALDRNRSLLALIDQLAPGEFEAAVAHFRSLGLTEDRMGEYALLLTAWAELDPTAALTYASENTQNGFATETILSAWATKDSEAAVRWAQANHQGDGANPYMPGIIRGIAASDPARATELLASMPRSVERAEGLDFIMPHLLEKGVEATRAWIAGLKDDALRNGAILRSAEPLAKTDPEGTVSWLLANPGEASQRRLDNVYNTWAQKDQQAALASFNALPAGENRSNALRGVVTSVAAKDPLAAVALMDRYPGDVTDRAVQNVIWHSFGSDPATAASQISRITNERDREQMYRRALNAWSERDSTAAQAWMQANPVPETIKQQVLRRQAERAPKN
jgi:hypothetical protein